jgi:transcriptional regulator with PAS, ATPase and Fis domain
LIEAVYQKKFREDLYYRLNTVPIYVPALRERGPDVELLFRKFAYDFSEKYRVDAIKLDETAKEVLLGFQFPGNIRQLKNLVEQISVLEMERHLNAETLKKYLPDHKRNLPALISKEFNKEGENYSERDLLYKILFDMKADMNDLKKMVLNMVSDNQSGSELLKQNESLFRDLNESEELVPQPYTRSPEESMVIEQVQENNTYELEKIEDVAHEMEDDDSLSIEKKEKELIIKALRKNRNKRKYAAMDLGISERTLYRKIKQYELEK